MKILGPIMQYFPYFSREDSKSLLHWSYQLTPKVLPSIAIAGLLWKPVGFERFLSFQDSVLQGFLSSERVKEVILLYKHCAFPELNVQKGMIESILIWLKVENPVLWLCCEVLSTLNNLF